MDSNVNLLNLHDVNSTNFLDSIISKGFLNCTFKATRFQNESKTLIDNILTNNMNSVNTGTIITDLSDHFCTFLQVANAHETRGEKTYTVNQFTEQNINNFRAALGGMNWNAVTETDDVDTACNEFWSIYTNLFNLIFPKKTVRFNKKLHCNQPFMSSGLLKSRATKDRLYLETLSDPSPESKIRYKNYRQLYFKTVRRAKKLYYTNKLKENVKNPKKTWQTLNEILDKGRGLDTVEKINIDGRTETDPKKISTHFNKFFTKVGKDISDSIQNVAKKAEDYINYGRDIPVLRLQNTTIEHVKKIIKSLSPKLSCDVSGISTKMIKSIGNEIALPLTHIFNLSLQKNKFPTCFKKCRVIPIFKSGNRMECDNYRPISLLSSISKVLEKIVAAKLLDHLLSNDLLYNFQFGFLPNRTTEQNLIHILNYITNALNENMFCVGVFLDLKKAFDVCSHDILLKKLQKMGVREDAHAWFTSYLSGREQCVDIANNFSEFIELAISVIQGSTLGPILFLCYINDFWACTKMFSVLFADDTTCLSKGHDLRILTDFVNIELQKMANWFRANKMAVNTAKTKFIIFRTHGKQVNPEDCNILYNSNEIGLPEDPNLIMPIERISNLSEEKSFKLLGVHFDEYLAFDHHITQLCSKISKSLYCINKIKIFIDVVSLKKLYFSMIHSHISYCINVYGCANQTNLAKLEVKQKQSIRAISHSGYRDHTAPLFKELKILPMEKLITYNRIKFMHSYTNRKLPISFAETWITVRDRNPNYVLRNANNLYVPPHRIELVKRLPLCSFPNAWNAMPDFKNNARIGKFLKDLKSHLLEAII